LLYFYEQGLVENIPETQIHRLLYFYEQGLVENIPETQIQRVKILISIKRFSVPSTKPRERPG